MIDFFIF